jgi:hypothetical protein
MNDPGITLLNGLLDAMLDLDIARWREDVRRQREERAREAAAVAEEVAAADEA